MGWHNETSEVVLKKLKSSKDGLGEAEVQKRYSIYGRNVIKQARKKSKLFIYLKQFNSLLVIILILAAVLSGLLGHLIDAIVIGFIVILNSAIGFIQEYKAEEIIEKLRKSLQYRVVVLRGSARKEIDSKLLVPGDIIFLEEGDRILADCRVLESEEMQVNESVLTGESFPVTKNSEMLRKNVGLAERKNMLYTGTTVVKGKGMNLRSKHLQGKGPIHF